MEQTLFFKELIITFERSANAYRQYLQGGRTFRFAQELKLFNNQALKLLEDNKTASPGDLQEDIQSLITHYREWSAKWERLHAEKEFGPDEVFVFANDITFPKQAAQNLEDFCRDLTSKG
jgi:hypothetical protein